MPLLCYQYIEIEYIDSVMSRICLFYRLNLPVFTLTYTVQLAAMIYSYMRISTDRHTAENQRSEILKKTSVEQIYVDHWIEETVLGRQSVENRVLSRQIKVMKPN